MLKERIYRYISIVLISVLSVPLSAQEKTSEPQQAPVEEKEKVPLISGVAVSVDLVGFSMKGVGARFANMEVAGRFNIKEKYFPIVELGIGDCTHKGGENTNEFSCTAPYYKVGLDYNINKKTNGNRFLAGARYAFTRYNYDYTSQDMTDPVYKVYRPLELTSLHGHNQWFELVVGFETKLWSIVRLGWNFRYKMRLLQNVSDMGEPYFVPGFGKNDVSTFGGTVNLVFDVGKNTFKKNKASKQASPK